MPGTPQNPQTTGQRVEYQRFPTSYFSGCDVDIYFRDLYIDEITAIEFQVQENVQPLYGYASYTVDTWARGNRMVTGTFRINFRTPYYIHYIINEIEYREGQDAPFDIQGHEYTPESKSADEVINQARGISSQDRFKQLSRQYQNSIWGETMDSPFKELMENRELDSFFYPQNRRPIVHEKGFDIIIKYGDVPKSSEETMIPTGQKSNTTMRSINGVQITGASQVIDGEGRPIEEEYTFLAKDIDSKL